MGLVDADLIPPRLIRVHVFVLDSSLWWTIRYRLHMHPLTQLRKLCQDYGITTMNHLGILGGVADGLMETRIAKSLSLQRSSVNMAVNIMELSGLLSKTRNKRGDGDGRRCTLSLTDEGVAFISAANKLFTSKIQ